MISADEMTALLVNTALRGRPIDTIPVPDCPDVALLLECDPSEAFEAWRICRDLVSRSHRWPIFTCEWGATSVAAAVFQYFPKPEAGQPADRRTRIERSEQISPVEALASFYRPEPVFADGSTWFAEDALAETASLFGDAPELSDLRSGVLKNATRIDVENWLFQWETGREPTQPRLYESAPLDEWYPPSDMPTGLVLLPTSRSWESLAFLKFYGADVPGGPERAMAILRSWHARFGAELWSNFDTMLDFVVRSPPEALQEAWQLAVEHYQLAPCTTQLPGDSVRTYARRLVGRTTWHLHERP